MGEATDDEDVRVPMQHWNEIFQTTELEMKFISDDITVRDDV